MPPAVTRTFPALLTCPTSTAPPHELASSPHLLVSDGGRCYVGMNSRNSFAPRLWQPRVTILPSAAQAPQRRMTKTSPIPSAQESSRRRPQIYLTPRSKKSHPLPEKFRLTVTFRAAGTENRAKIEGHAPARRHRSSTNYETAESPLASHISRRRAQASSASTKDLKPPRKTLRPRRHKGLRPLSPIFPTTISHPFAWGGAQTS